MGQQFLYASLRPNASTNLRQAQLDRTGKLSRRTAGALKIKGKPRNKPRLKIPQIDPALKVIG